MFEKLKAIREYKQLKNFYPEFADSESGKNFLKKFAQKLSLLPKLERKYYWALKENDLEKFKKCLHDGVDAKAEMLDIVITYGVGGYVFNTHVEAKFCPPSEITTSSEIKKLLEQC